VSFARVLSAESTGANISFCPGTFLFFSPYKQRHLAWHVMRLKLYRELSAARCVNGIPTALIAAVYEEEVKQFSSLPIQCERPTAAVTVADRCDV